MSPSLHQAAETLRALLFPPRCITCRELLPPFDRSGTALCPLCRTPWETAMAEAAEQSGQDEARGLVYLTFYRPGHTEGIPEQLIYHLKHKGDPRAFDFVATRLAPRVLRAAETIPKRLPDPTEPPETEAKPLLFTYPPRRPEAVRADGFDQAAKLAQSLSRLCAGEYVSLIRRTNRKSHEQKKLDAAARQENAENAYTLSPNAESLVRGRTVVICDDLRTTGATLGRCADLLVKAGADAVILTTVASTEERKNHE